MKSERQNTAGEKLLREYLMHLLEDSFGASTLSDAGISAGDISAAAGPHGMAFGSKEDLKNTFITPFTDVFKTAVGKSKEITRKGRTLLTVGFATILTTLIPVLGARYSEIFRKEKEDINKIRSQYKDVYERTNKALSSTDAAFVAFMTAPDLALSALALHKAPGVAKDVLSVLTGGASDSLFDKVMSNNFGDSARRKSVGESILREVSEEEAAKKILSNKKFLRKALSGSRDFQAMQDAASKIYKNSLKNVYAQAVQILKDSRTIEDLERITGKKIPEAEKIKQLQGEEKEAAEKMLINATRKSMKDFYIKNLQSQVDSVLSAGIPEESPYVSDFREVIQKIKSL